MPPKKDAKAGGSKEKGGKGGAKGGKGGAKEEKGTYNKQSFFTKMWAFIEEKSSDAAL